MRTDPTLNVFIALGQRRDDMATVLGVAAQDASAIGALESLIEVGTEVLAAETDRALLEEAAAAVFKKLVEVRPGKEPGILAFRGEQSLRRWVRTQLARETALRSITIH